VLQGREEIDGYAPKLKHLEGSNLPVGDMETTITVNAKESNHKTHWARFSEFGCVAGNGDRSTPPRADVKGLDLRGKGD
jgi:hypothetical protein